jgi:predicted DNA-binding WGR domain protein
VRWRLRIDEASQPRVWELALEGSTLTITTGPEGSAGVVRQIACASPAAALKTAEALVAQRRADGFTDAHEVPLDQERLLLQADDGRWLVWADERFERGDVPRGKLVGLQLAAAQGDAAAGRRATRLLATHADELLGALAPLRRQVELRWAAGMIRHATVHAQAPRTPRAAPLEEVLSALLSSPSVQFLQGLTLGLPGPVGSYDLALERLSRLKWPRHLTHLELGPPSVGRLIRAGAGWPSVRALAPLNRQGTQLTALIVRASVLTLPGLALPGLRFLELTPPVLPRRALLDVLHAQLPALQGLLLQPGLRARLEPDDFGPLFRDGPLPALAALGLRACPEVLRVVERLEHGGRLARLQLLDLSFNGLREPQARWLAAHAPALRHLARLNLQGNPLGVRATRLLREKLPRSDVSERRVHLRR